MKQHVKKQYWILVAELAATGIANLFTAYYLSPVWLAGLLILTLYARNRFMHIQCVACHDPLLYREYRLLGIDFTGWWPTLPKHCQTCDHPVAG